MANKKPSPLAGWRVRLRTAVKWLRSTTIRLASSYLAIIMLMSIGFSIVFYNTSSHELGRQVPSPANFGVRHYEDLGDDGSIAGGGPDIEQFFRDRISQGRHELMLRLLYLNILALLAGASISYYLARRTLEPIEANMEAQNQFVSDASHELRTPLAALQTTNEVALRRQKLPAAEVRQLLRDNVEEVQKLKLLTDGLLRLARQDVRRPVLEPAALPPLVTDAINSVIAPAQAKQIAVHDKIPPCKVAAEPASLTQALVALLDNAIKYSPHGSAIYVEARTQGHWLLLQIRDEGCGIAARDLPHIFDRFYRADQSRNKRQAEGYGIGLSIVQKIVEQHHGDISVRSHPGKGTTFMLRLPLVA